MAQDDLYLEFLNKIKAGKTDQQFADMVTGLMKFGSSQLYTALVYVLTEEDLKSLDAIENDAKRDIEMERLFKLRSGVSTEEFITNLRDTVSKNYLFPQLSPQKQ